MAGLPETFVPVPQHLLPQGEHPSIQEPADALDLLVLHAVIALSQQAIDSIQQGKRTEARFLRQQVGELLGRSRVIDEQVAAIGQIIFPPQDSAATSMELDTNISVNGSPADGALPTTDASPASPITAEVPEQERFTEEQKKWQAMAIQVEEIIHNNPEILSKKEEQALRILIESQKSNGESVLRSVMVGALYDGEVTWNTRNAFNVLFFSSRFSGKRDKLGIRVRNIFSKKEMVGKKLEPRYVVEVVGVEAALIARRGEDAAGTEDEDGTGDVIVISGKSSGETGEKEKSRPTPSAQFIGGELVVGVTHVVSAPKPFERGQPEILPHGITIIPDKNSSRKKVIIGGIVSFDLPLASYSAVFTNVVRASGRAIALDEALPPIFGSAELRKQSVLRAINYINGQMNVICMRKDFIVWEGETRIKAVFPQKIDLTPVVPDVAPIDGHASARSMRLDSKDREEEEKEEEKPEELITIGQRLLLSAILLNPSASRILRVLGLSRIEDEARNRLQGIYNTYKLLVEIEYLEPEDVDALRKGLTTFIQIPASIDRVEDPDLKSLLHLIQGLKEQDVDRLLQEIPSGIRVLLDGKREAQKTQPSSGAPNLRPRRTR